MTIDTKLEEVRERIRNAGQQYGRKETADDFLKITYAELYEDAPEGTVPERDAWVKRQAKYRQAVERKADAYAEWKTTETFLKLLFAEVEVWRSQNATNRMTDRAHR